MKINEIIKFIKRTTNEMNKKGGQNFKDANLILIFISLNIIKHK